MVFTGAFLRQFVVICPVAPGAGPLDTLGHPGGGQVDPGVRGAAGWRVVVGHGGGGVAAGAEGQVPDSYVSCGVCLLRPAQIFTLETISGFGFSTFSSTTPSSLIS